MGELRPDHTAYIQTWIEVRTILRSPVTAFIPPCRSDKNSHAAFPIVFRAVLSKGRLGETVVLCLL